MIRFSFSISEFPVTGSFSLFSLLPILKWKNETDRHWNETASLLSTYEPWLRCFRRSFLSLVTFLSSFSISAICLLHWAWSFFPLGKNYNRIYNPIWTRNHEWRTYRLGWLGGGPWLGRANRWWRMRSSKLQFYKLIFCSKQEAPCQSFTWKWDESGRSWPRFWCLNLSPFVKLTAWPPPGNLGS